MKTLCFLAMLLGVVAIAQAEPVLQMERSLPAVSLMAEAHLAIKNHRFVEAESILTSIVESDSGQDEAYFWLAKVQAWQGNFAHSSANYQTLLEKEPNNSDYRLGQAQVLVWSGKPKEALPLLESTRRLNPSDPDILRLFIQAKMTLGDANSKAEALQLTQEAKLMFPKQNWEMFASTTVASTTTTVNELRTLDALDRNLMNTHSNQVEAGVGYDTFSKGRGNGRSEYLTFEHRYAPRKLAYATLQDSARFSNNDQQLLVGGYYPIPSNMTLNVEGSVSGSHKMVPMNSEMASLQVPIFKGGFITGGVRRSQYTANTSYQEFGVLEWYVKDYRLAYTLTSTQSRGETLFGNRASLSRYYNEISYVTLSLGQGREVELDQGQNIFFNTTSISLNGRHWFNKDWAMAWSIACTQQDTAYTRTGGSFGIRHAF